MQNLGAQSNKLQRTIKQALQGENLIMPDAAALQIQVLVTTTPANKNSRLQSGHNFR